MEHDCHIFSKYLVFQIKNLVFQSKFLAFRSKTLDLDQNTRYFESEISKDQVIHTLNLKYQVFPAKYLIFQRRCEIQSFLLDFMYVLQHRLPQHLRIHTLNKYQTLAQLDQQQEYLTTFVDLLPIQRVRAAYGIRLSHVFEIPSISIEMPSISIGNLGF